jgi:murein DD-endopeptidase MepM/ murein hydrolase activator NlpD
MILFLMPHKKIMTLAVYAAAAVLVFVSIFGIAYSAWPELSDDDAPQLVFDGIKDGGFYNGVLSLAFSVKDQTTAVARVRLRIDQDDVYDKAVGQKIYADRLNYDTVALSEGDHRLVITVIDSSLWKQLLERTIVFRVDRTPPRLQVKLLKAAVLMGDTGGLLVAADEPLATLSIEAIGRGVRSYPLPGRANAYRALFGVSQFAKPAVYRLRLVARDLAGNETIETPAVNVQPRQFPFETIDLPKEKQGILSDTRRILEDRDKMKQALAGCRDTQFWQGLFIRPAPGIDSSSFGIRRVYSGGQVASSHQGIDIANKEGTPITASNSGAVLLAEELFVDGNTVILDHGQGVVSFYFHMKALAVKKGDVVAKGAVLGSMGTTGLSTGNHCHWELKVDGVSVNPDDWRTFSFEATE